MDLCKLIRIEIVRSRSLHPQRMDFFRFVGVINAKMFSIMRKTGEHQLQDDPGMRRWVACSCLHIAVVAVRFIEEGLGGLTEDDYRYVVNLTDQTHELPLQPTATTELQDTTADSMLPESILP